MMGNIRICLYSALFLSVALLQFPKNAAGNVQHPGYSMSPNTRCTMYVGQVSVSFEDAERECKHRQCPFIMNTDCRNNGEYHVCTNKRTYVTKSDVYSCVYQKDHQDQKFYVDDGCQTESGKTGKDDAKGEFISKSLQAGVRCCSMDGSQCATPGKCNTKKDDPITVTYDEADVQCGAFNATTPWRLCTKDELLTDICCGTGGLCDNHAVWTSTYKADNGYTCSEGMYCTSHYGSKIRGEYETEVADKCTQDSSCVAYDYGSTWKTGNLCNRIEYSRYEPYKMCTKED